MDHFSFSTASLDAMRDSNDLMNKYNSLLVDYLRYFNLLELNVGLCIRRLSGIDESEIHRKLDKMSFEKKLEYLLELSSKENDSELKNWCKEAHARRQERNMYMHGQWAFIPHLEEGVEFLLAPWVEEKYCNIYPGKRFTLEKLESIVLDIRACFNDFNKLRDKNSI